MNIDLHKITVRELVDGYHDNGEGGVRGYSGKLDIRPPFQREFVYDNKQRDAVIDTVMKDFPLNVMYWAVRDDGTYEIIDGQQRTISVAQYVRGDFSFKKLSFGNLPDDKQTHILDYELFVYLCSGTDSEKLEWFETINIAGERLFKQELRNAVYAGPWVSDAKRYFSRSGCAAYQVGNPYLKGSPIRQDYLETAIRWISGGDIESYMDRHRSEPSAIALWNYFRSVIDWVRATFTEERLFMRGVDWGALYDAYKDKSLDPAKLEEEITGLILDDDVTNKRGIYPYVLTRDEKDLNIRAFSPAMKRKVYEKQDKRCANKECGRALVRIPFREMEADHITPWVEGGKTNEENCQMLCRDCNRRKSSK